MITKRTFLKSVMAASIAAVSVSAVAMDKVKVGYMKIPPLVHMIHAQETGIFTKNDLDVDLTIVNGGPALMTALASNSVEIGMTAVPVVMLARTKGLKLKAFGTGDLESPGDERNWIVAGADSGINSPKDLEGKTVGIVAKKSPAELTVRDHVLADGGDPDKVNLVSLPFPQLPSALEVGNVDAIMVGEPFHTQAHNLKGRKALDISQGLTSTLEQDGPTALGGWFAGDDWLADEHNRDIAARFLKSIIQSNRELAADRTLVNKIFERDFGMPAEVAKRVPLPLNTETLKADPASYEAGIRALARTGMIKAEYPVEEVVDVISYE